MQDPGAVVGVDETGEPVTRVDLQLEREKIQLECERLALERDCKRKRNGHVAINTCSFHPPTQSTLGNRKSEPQQMERRKEAHALRLREQTQQLAKDTTSRARKPGACGA